jgi:hypothetical protein
MMANRNTFGWLLLQYATAIQKIVLAAFLVWVMANAHTLRNDLLTAQYGVGLLHVPVFELRKHEEQRNEGTYQEPRVGPTDRWSF